MRKRPRKWLVGVDSWARVRERVAPRGTRTGAAAASRSSWLRPVASPIAQPLAGALAVVGGFRGVGGHQGFVESLPVGVGRGVDELHLAGSGEVEGGFLLRRGVAGFFPDDPALVVEGDEAESLQAFGVGGGGPEDEAFDGAGGLEVKFPPRTLLLGGSGDGFVRGAGVRPAVGGTIGGGGLRGAALGRGAGRGDVFPIGEGLEFGELERTAAREFESHEADRRAGLVRHRQNPGADLPEGEVPGQAGALPGEGGVGQGLEADGGEGGLGVEGDLDGVGVFQAVGARGGDEEAVVLAELERGAGLGAVGGGTRGLPGESPREDRGPGRGGRREVGRGGPEPVLEGGEFVGQPDSLGAEGIRVELQERGFVGAIRVRGVVEDGEELEVLLLGDGIVLVGVALGAGHRGSHPNGEGGVEAVDDGDVAELLVAGAAFAVGHRVAMEGGRHGAVPRWVRAAGHRRVAPR
jgi:hypothetical protein